MMPASSCWPAEEARLLGSKVRLSAQVTAARGFYASDGSSAPNGARKTIIHFPVTASACLAFSLSFQRQKGCSQSTTKCRITLTEMQNC